jgi:hypothetical protein
MRNLFVTHSLRQGAQIPLEEEGKYAVRPTTPGSARRSLETMNRRAKRRLLLSVLFLGLLLLAVAAWTVEGMRFALGVRRPLTAT